MQMNSLKDFLDNYGSSLAERIDRELNPTTQLRLVLS